MDADFTIRQLEYFFAVARHNSFTKAAQELFTSQPNVSTQIRKLENSLGVKLFSRKRSSVELTEAGRALHDRVATVFKEIQAVTHLAQDFTGVKRGTLYVGATATAGNFIIPEHMAEFLSGNPDTNIELRIGNTATIVEMLADSDIEVAICGQPSTSDDLHSRPFYTDPMVIVAPPGLVEDRLIGRDQFLTLPKVVREQGSSTAERMERLLVDLGPEAMDSIVARVDGTLAVNQCVASGVGISVVSRRSAEQYIQDGSIVTLDLEGGFDWEMTFYLVYPKHRHISPIAEAFLEVFEPAAAELKKR